MSKIKLTPFEKKYKERINIAALFGTTEEDFYPLSDADIRRHCNEFRELIAQEKQNKI